jgi:predicted DNA-binding protein
MGVVSVRLPDDVEAYLRHLGITPSTLAKELVEKEARRLRIQEARQYLESVSRKPSKPIADIVREIRDEH